MITYLLIIYVCLNKPYTSFCNGVVYDTPNVDNGRTTLYANGNKF